MPAITLARPSPIHSSSESLSHRATDVRQAAQPSSQRAIEDGESQHDGEALRLFRRAVSQGDADAWDVIIEQYGPLVRHWVRQHPSAAALHEDDQYWMTRTFERFWAALQPNRLDRFAHLAAVLQYLKLCVHSVVVSELRANVPMPAPAVAAWARASEMSADVEDPEHVVVGKADAQEFWRTVDEALADETERLLLYLTFVRGLPPREVQARAPERFPSAADVYRVKRNALDRLRRSPQMGGFRAA